MLVPQFSLRWLLAAVAVCAGVSLVLAAAMRGAPWAFVATAGMALVAFTLLVHATFFAALGLLARAAAAVRRRRAQDARGAPLAAAASPPER